MVREVSVFKHLNFCILAVNMCNSFPLQTAARNSYLEHVIGTWCQPCLSHISAHSNEGRSSIFMNSNWSAAKKLYSSLIHALMKVVREGKVAYINKKVTKQ
jgi:hypothetical protein